MDDTISGWFALNMADGRVLQQLVAAAGHTAWKIENIHSLFMNQNGQKANFTNGIGIDLK